MYLVEIGGYHTAVSFCSKRDSWSCVIALICIQLDRIQLDL